MDDEVYMVTTTDNPFSPFTQFDRWRAFDVQKRYYTLEYLARVANTSHELSFEDQLSIMNDAINDVVAIDALGLYRKVKESDYKQ